MGEQIPLRDKRKVCYQARDSFFTCCDKNGIEDPLKDVITVQRLCRREKQRFEYDCISSWVPGPTSIKDMNGSDYVKVDYFMRKRIIDKRKELMYAKAVAHAGENRRAVTIKVTDLDN